MSQGDLLHVVTADDISARRKPFGRAIVWGSALVVAARRGCRRRPSSAGIADFGFSNWRPTLYAYILWADLPLLEPGADPRRARQAHAVRAAGRAVRRVADGLPAAVRAAHRLLELEPVLAARPPVQRPRQCPADVERSVLLERAAQHGLVHAWRSSSNTRSPSAWRCCSTPRSAPGSSSASPSCCR